MDRKKEEQLMIKSGIPEKDVNQVMKILQDKDKHQLEPWELFDKNNQTFEDKLEESLIKLEESLIKLEETEYMLQEAIYEMENEE